MKPKISPNRGTLTFTELVSYDGCKLFPILSKENVSILKTGLATCEARAAEDRSS
jgi:hypothetical protein